jgi:hypothetical protein
MSDDPLEDPGDDPRSRYFDRGAFVTSVAGVVAAAREQSSSSVFGLIGEWGSGKTTIISSLLTQLRASGWRTHQFNPWLYSDATSLQWGFFSELRAAVPPGDKWNDTRANLDQLRNTVVPMARLASFLGTDLGGAAADLLNPEKASAVKLRRKVRAQLEGMITPVLVVVDDLDRLTASELLEVFKLVRFVGRIPNVYYLLCYDEKTLIDMLEKTDLVGESNERRALHYLEKIVQLRFDIPPLRSDLVEELFEQAVRALAERNKLDLNGTPERRLIELISTGLLDRLTTPRAIKHLFAQLEAFLPAVGTEVDLVDFILLSWIRTFEPALYGLIRKNRKFLLTGDVGFVLDDKAALELRKAALTGMLSEAGIHPTHQSETTTVLQELFPAVRRIQNGQSTAYLPDGDARRLSDDHYFDRYFQFGVPTDDLPDATVRVALEDLTDAASPELQVVEEHLVSNAPRTISKLQRERDKSTEQSLSIARWALRVHAGLPRQNGWFAPRERLTSFLSEVVVDMEKSDAELIVKEAVQADVETCYMILDTIRLLCARQMGNGRDVADWNLRGRDLNTVALPLLPAAVATHGREDVFDLDTDFFSLLVAWQALDTEGPQKFIQEQLASGTWSTIDVLARLVTTSVAIGSPEGTRSYITGFDAKWVGQFVDLQAARAKLRAEIEEGVDLPPEHTLEATPEARRTYVLAWLKAFPD